MGQRETIVQYLVSGGIVVPVVVLTGIVAMLGSAAIPVAVTMMSLGFAALVVAKWPLSRKEFWLSFGPSGLAPLGRKLYWAAYVMLACGLLVVLLGFAFARLPA